MNMLTFVNEFIYIHVASFPGHSHSSIGLLQYVNTEGEGLGDLIKHSVVRKMDSRHTGSGALDRLYKKGLRERQGRVNIKWELLWSGIVPPCVYNPSN